MNRQEFHQILRRYIAGDSSDEEKNLVDQWYELLDDESLPEFSNEELESIRSEIFQKIKSSPAEETPVIELKNQGKGKWYWVAAVAIITGVIAAVFFWKLKDNSKTFEEPYLSAVTSKFTETRNDSDKPEKIILDDKSIVTLAPGSGIKYPIHFNEEKREVYMQGEAFFEVHKNPKQPFYVYNNSIVTHVLGTSFNVKWDEKNKTIQVDVRTGRVEVLENSSVVNTKDVAKTNGIILTPNQKVIYHQQSGQFEASIADKPLPVIAEEKLSEEGVSFVFDETPLSTVLKAIEKQFDIDIVVENEDVLDNVFTGDISKQDLFKKLDIVCKSLTVCYEVKGTKILVRNYGCN